MKLRKIFCRKMCVGIWIRTTRLHGQLFLVSLKTKIFKKFRDSRYAFWNLFFCRVRLHLMGIIFSRTYELKIALPTTTTCRTFSFEVQRKPYTESRAGNGPYEWMGGLLKVVRIFSFLNPLSSSMCQIHK